MARSEQPAELPVVVQVSGKGRGRSRGIGRPDQKAHAILVAVAEPSSRQASTFVDRRGAKPETYLFRLDQAGFAACHAYWRLDNVQGSFGYLESFLLQARPREAGSRLCEAGWKHPAADIQKTAARRRLLRETGSQLGQLHRANFYLEPARGGQSDQVFAVMAQADGTECVMLDRADLLISRRDESIERAQQDLRSLWRSLSGQLLTRTDCLRFLLAYRGAKVVDRPERMLWNRLAKNRSGWALAGRAAPGWCRLRSHRKPDRRMDSVIYSVRGCRRFWQHEEWAHVLPPDWHERIMTVDVTDRFHAKQGRSTGRWDR